MLLSLPFQSSQDSGRSLVQIQANCKLKVDSRIRPYFKKRNINARSPTCNTNSNWHCTHSFFRSFPSLFLLLDMTWIASAHSNRLEDQDQSRGLQIHSSHGGSSHCNILAMYLNDKIVLMK